MKTPLLTGLVSALAIAAVAVGQGVPQLLDTTGIRTLSTDALTAHTLGGELAWGSGFALETPGPITYASGIENIDQQQWGPFEGAFTGSAIRDDYVKGITGGGDMTSFHFVGGVATGGQQAAFFFLDTDENVVDSFSVTFPQGGDFVWSINLKDAGFQSADAGFVQIQGVDDVDVSWFFTDSTGFLFGDNVFDDGNETGDWTDTRYAFKIRNEVPAPGALALLGLAGLVGARRRRRN